MDKERSVNIAIEADYTEKELSKMPINTLYQLGINEKIVNSTEKVLERNEINNIRNLDIDRILEETIEAYKNGNQTDFEDYFIIIMARFQAMFIKRIRYTIYRKKYLHLLNITPYEEFQENVLSFYWTHVMKSIYNWSKNGIPKKEDFSITGYMGFISSRIKDYIDDTYFKPNIIEKENDKGKTREPQGEKQNPQHEITYVKLEEFSEYIIDNQENIDDKMINREKIRDLVYSILNTHVRADKVVGTAFRIFLGYTNEAYWEIAINKSFKQLFNVFITKAQKVLFIDPQSKLIIEFTDYLNNEWSTYDNAVQAYLNGDYVITYKYISAKDMELTRWTSYVRKQIREVLD